MRMQLYPGAQLQRGADLPPALPDAGPVSVESTVVSLFANARLFEGERILFARRAPERRGRST